MALSPEREGRFTASSHAVALGLGWESPQKFWRKWHGIEAENDYVSGMMDEGKEHEADALASYEAITGDIVTHCMDRQEFIKWEDWSGCTPDGRTQLGLVDFKCIQKKMPDEPKLLHWIQLQSQMQFTDEGVADLCAWTPDETRIWRTKKSDKYWPTVELILKDYHSCLTSGLEPKRGQFKKIPLEATWERIA